MTTLPLLHPSLVSLRPRPPDSPGFSCSSILSSLTHPLPSSSTLMLEPRIARIVPRRSGVQKLLHLKKSPVYLSFLDIAALFPLRQADAANKLVSPTNPLLACCGASD